MCAANAFDCKTEESLLNVFLSLDLTRLGYCFAETQLTRDRGQQQLKRENRSELLRRNDGACSGPLIPSIQCPLSSALLRNVQIVI